MKKNIHILFLIVLFFKISPIQSQIIESGDKIILTNIDVNKRQVNEIINAENESDALNLRLFMNGNFNFGMATGLNDTLHISFTPGITSLQPGLLFSFIAPFTNDNSVIISIDSISGYFPLAKKGTKPLDTSDVIPGQLVTVVYDGTRFQVISELHNGCPIGFIKVTEEYCITPTEKDSIYFWNAVTYCGNQNARICNWGEWYYACLNSTSLGITGMLGNYEWIDGGGNSLSWTTPVTSATGMMGGWTSCIDVTSSIVDITHTHSKARPKPFRCCYSLRKND